MKAFDELRLRTGAYIDRLHLYPIPADWVFARSLHFIARMDVR